MYAYLLTIQTSNRSLNPGRPKLRRPGMVIFPSFHHNPTSTGKSKSMTDSLLNNLQIARFEIRAHGRGKWSPRTTM